MHVEEEALTKEEIVHDKRPAGADAIIEKIRNEQIHPSVSTIGNEKKQLRRQKTRDKLIFARDVLKEGKKNWVVTSGEQPVIVSITESPQDHGETAVPSTSTSTASNTNTNSSSSSSK